MFDTHSNKQQNFGRVVPRMGIYSLNKLCKCNFHRTQCAIFTRRKLKRGNNSLKSGDVFALALRKQAGYLGLYGAGLFHVCCIRYCKQRSDNITGFCLIYILGNLLFFVSSDDERMEVDSPRKSRKVPECQTNDGDYEPKPTSRRNRLAALAQTINTWEDDLSRPVIK